MYLSYLFLWIPCCISKSYIICAVLVSSIILVSHMTHNFSCSSWWAHAWNAQFCLIRTAGTLLARVSPTNIYDQYISPVHDCNLVKLDSVLLIYDNWNSARSVNIFQGLHVKPATSRFYTGATDLGKLISSLEVLLFKCN